MLACVPRRRPRRLRKRPAPPPSSAAATTPASTPPLPSLEVDRDPARPARPARPSPPPTLTFEELLSPVCTSPALTSPAPSPPTRVPVHPADATACPRLAPPPPPLVLRGIARSASTSSSSSSSSTSCPACDSPLGPAPRSSPGGGYSTAVTSQGTSSAGSCAPRRNDSDFAEAPDLSLALDVVPEDEEALGSASPPGCYGGGGGGGGGRGGGRGGLWAQQPASSTFSLQSWSEGNSITFRRCADAPPRAISEIGRQSCLGSGELGEAMGVAEQGSHSYPRQIYQRTSGLWALVAANDRKYCTWGAGAAKSNGLAKTRRRADVVDAMRGGEDGWGQGGGGGGGGDDDGRGGGFEGRSRDAYYDESYAGWA